MGLFWSYIAEPCQLARKVNYCKVCETPYKYFVTTWSTETTRWIQEIGGKKEVVKEKMCLSCLKEMHWSEQMSQYYKMCERHLPTFLLHPPLFGVQKR